MFRKIFIVILIICSAFSLFAEEYTVTSKVIWPEDKIIIDIVFPFQLSERPLPAMKKQMEEKISEDLKGIIFNELSGMFLDSHTRVKEFLKENPAAIPMVFSLADKAERESSLFSKNMKSLKLKYTIRLYPDVAEIFVPPSPHEELEKILKFVPSADFTGIVIYVKGDFTPSLFPRIYDQSMNLIMDKFHVDPEKIKQWGTVRYGEDLDFLKEIDRIGPNPLKLTARGLFGINNTDIIISSLEAEKILSRDNNINLIYQGRILIVY